MVAGLLSGAVALVALVALLWLLRDPGSWWSDGTPQGRHRKRR